MRLKPVDPRDRHHVKAMASVWCSLERLGSGSGEAGSGLRAAWERTERGWLVFEIAWGRIEGCVRPNGRQNERRCRRFCRSGHEIQAKIKAAPRKTPRIHFKTAKNPGKNLGGEVVT